MIQKRINKSRKKIVCVYLLLHPEKERLIFDRISIGREYVKTTSIRKFNY